MRSLLTRSRDESGQVLIFVAFILTVIVGMAALVVDVGLWYQNHRHLQTAADAGALAGAQVLPNQSLAQTDALDWTDDNYSAAAVAFPEPKNDHTITVRTTASAPAIFARIFEVLSNEDTAIATAQIHVPLEMKNVAPIAVHVSEACIVTDPSCFGADNPINLVFNEDDPFDPTKSKFGLLNLDRDGNVGASDLKGWIEDGYPGHLPINTDYPPANGEKNGIKKELDDAADEQRMLFFPVFDTANASTGYHIIGWAAFVIDEVVKWTGKTHEIEGHFVTFIASDLAAGDTLSDPDLNFGVRVITLTQ